MAAPVARDLEARSGEARRSSWNRAGRFSVFVASVSYTSFIATLEFTKHIVMAQWPQ